MNRTKNPELNDTMSNLKMNNGITEMDVTWRLTLFLLGILFGFVAVSQDTSEEMKVIAAPTIELTMEPEVVAEKWKEFREKRDDITSVKILSAHKETGAIITSIDPYAAFDFMLTMDAEEGDLCVITAYPLSEVGRQVLQLSIEQKAKLVPILRDFKRFAETGYIRSPEWPQPPKNKKRI